MKATDRRKTALGRRLGNSIRVRALVGLLVSVGMGFFLSHLSRVILQRLDLMPFDPNGQVGFLFFFAMIFAVLLLIAWMPLMLKPIATLNSRLREQRVRSESRHLDPREFAELAPLVETLLDYADWAEKQQHMSAAIHHAFRERIEHLAEYDTLTRLYNRHYLEVVLPLQIAHVKGVNDALSFIMLDVDNFKHYNDTNGHPEGDKVLARIAGILRSKVREHDICCRYGGEEFGIVLPSATARVAFLIGERIRCAIEEAPFAHEEKQPLGVMTASLGVATFPEEAKDPQQLIEFADKALYLAKSHGRNRTCRYADLAQDDLDEIAWTRTENRPSKQ